MGADDVEVTREGNGDDGDATTATSAAPDAAVPDAASPDAASLDAAVADEPASDATAENVTALDSDARDAPSPAAASAPAADAAGKLFIGRVSRRTTTESLRTFFSEFGELSDVALIQDRATGKPRGFGFVKFKDAAAADAVIAHACESKIELDGRDIDIKQAVPRSRGHPNRC